MKLSDFQTGLVPNSYFTLSSGRQDSASTSMPARKRSREHLNMSSSSMDTGDEGNVIMIDFALNWMLSLFVDCGVLQGIIRFERPDTPFY